MNITSIACPGHEQVIRVEDSLSALTGFIAIHSTRLGPAAGGLRMRPYDTEDAALEDVLRLSRGMTFKNAAADLPLGGGKAVIIGDARAKTRAQLVAFARAIDGLRGRYWTAEDMGVDPGDMAVMASVTPYVAGLPDGAFSTGDPSPVTARGIFHAIRTTARYRFGSPLLEGRHVAVQGLGQVGWHLSKLLRAAGARLTVADIDAERAEWAGQSFGAVVVAPDRILAVEADILAPCAIGAVLNAQTIPALRVQAVAGGANNQLAAEADGAALHARGILYAPDYVANAGGIINIATEILKIRDRRRFVSDRLTALDATLETIFKHAAERDVGPDRVADEIVAAKMQGAEAA
ncbi:Glu/Leu/Phe/Val dehydrogenase [Rhodophyticola sp. CCM32]|uniref:Glu/Leu/Phe/Val family dehydrogenase n=1 Tax=Rhodophyticola sp. CCM32 TaxID=2916397 RepID=UPI00107F3BD4|nr:Glu/Leu/Phe/Val dehydrogenase dimerization domain-containing protein [Rhodophyticola sp. CCM32]QBY01082.1 Glu/Leu/Phe/Val dehydrogenase [Rhodophyticola sp. CCM32]